MLCLVMVAVTRCQALNGCHTGILRCGRIRRGDGSSALPPPAGWRLSTRIRCMPA
jgi:hypothetical protein